MEKKITALTVLISIAQAMLVAALFAAVAWGLVGLASARDARKVDSAAGAPAAGATTTATLQQGK